MFWFPNFCRCFHLERPSTLNLAVDSKINRIQFKTTRRFENVEETFFACWRCICTGYRSFGGHTYSALQSLFGQRGLSPITFASAR